MSFRNKLIVVTGVSVAIGLAASLGAAFHSTRKLSLESSEVIRHGIERSSREYLEHVIDDTAQRTQVLFQRFIAELDVVADVAQTLVDREDDGIRLATLAGHLPLISDRLTYRPELQTWSTAPSEPTLAVLWSYLLDTNHQVSPKVQAALSRTSLLDLVMPAALRRGSPKLQVYYVGDMDVPYLRIAPWSDVAATFHRLYPEGLLQNFWTFFFPGLVPGWMAWARHPQTLKAMSTHVTFVPPYDDAAGGGLVITAFRPLWRQDLRFAGAIGIDLTLEQLNQYVEHVRVAQSGFAFIVQQNGNLLAVHREGAQKLGIPSSTTNRGLDMLDRLLSKSREPGISALRLPVDATRRFDEIAIGGEPHVVVLQRLPPLRTLADGEIVEESWTLGIMVPKHELYAPLAAAQTAVATRTRSILRSLGLIATATLGFMLIGVAALSERITRGMRALADGASRIMRKEYDARVWLRSNDELGQLAAAFNAMAAEVESHTRGLEGLIHERTALLEKANAEIGSLNEILKAENLRLGAELDVGRRLQTMVLPQARELRELRDLDISAFMQPAAEVGGDYYDVVPEADGVVLGIGDVTGHGLESGVLMMMVQTSIRALLAADETDLRKILSVVNKVLFKNVQRISMDHSVTLSLLRYERDQLTVAGQHEEVIVVRRDGQLERLSTVELGFPLGLEYDIGALVAQVSIPLGPGDVVVAYTDGVVEAENRERDQYGLERLCDVLRHHHGISALQIKEAILADLMSFIGETEIIDDLTLLVAKRM